MPKLEKLYKEIKEEGKKKFEIIQISSEKSEVDFNAEMTENRDWLYVPFNSPTIPKLVEQFKVEFLPKFIIVYKDMFILVENARKDIEKLEEDDSLMKAFDKWYLKYRDRKDMLEMQKKEEEKSEESEENEEEELSLNNK